MVSKVFIAFCAAAVLFSSSVDAGYNWASVLNSGQLQHGDVRGPLVHASVCWAFHDGRGGCAAIQAHRAAYLQISSQSSVNSCAGSAVLGALCSGCASACQTILPRVAPGWFNASSHHSLVAKYWLLSTVFTSSPLHILPLGVLRAAHALG